MKITGHNSYPKYGLAGQNNGTFTKKQRAQSIKDKRAFKAAQVIPYIMQTNNFMLGRASCLSYRHLKGLRPNKSNHISKRDLAKQNN